MDIMVKLLYFFKLVDTLGLAQEELALPTTVQNVGALLSLLQQRGEPYQTAFADSSAMQITINKKFADTEALIQSGDEIAFFPKGR
jgi:molybdopterin synthase sulfur carrier subunit